MKKEEMKKRQRASTKISDETAKQILEILAKRLGFKGVNIVRFEDESCLAFISEIESQSVLVTVNAGLEIFTFKPNATFADCLLCCLENRKVCGVDTPVRESKFIFAVEWMPVFKDSDTLEKLAIEADLEVQHGNN